MSPEAIVAARRPASPADGPGPGAQETPRVAYVMKMYPRFSETFILNEILAHQRAGLSIEIFSLRPPLDGQFHEALADVRGRVTYLSHGHLKAADLWERLRDAGRRRPELWAHMPELTRAEALDALQAVELAEIARARGITHLHAHFGSVATTVARLASRLSEIPYTFTAHAKDIFHDGVEPADLGAKLRDARAVITVSDFNVDHLRAAYGPAAARVERIYNGLDLTAFPYRSPAERAPAIIAVGRLVEKKGFADLIDACALMSAAGRRFTCAIVGAGPLEGALAERIARLELDGTVRLAGALPQGRLRDVVQDAAVMAAPCVIGADGNRDGMPTVLVEAMALGTPVVATDIVGISEIVRPERTGLLVPAASPPALAAALGRMLDEPALRTRLAQGARALVERELDIERQSARLRAAIRAVAAPSRERRNQA